MNLTIRYLGSLAISPMLAMLIALAIVLVVRRKRR